MKTKNKLYHYSAEVTRVVDGDTVDAFVDLGFDMHSKQRVRLFGINTPECRTRDKEEKKRGLAAKARLKEMLSEEKRYQDAARQERKVWPCARRTVCERQRLEHPTS